jgi:hypothetical protein
MERFLIIAALMVIGCGGAEHYPNTDTTGPMPSTSSDGIPCVKGSQAECTMYLNAHGSVTFCYKGMVTCDSTGHWGPCVGPGTVSPNSQ